MFDMIYGFPQFVGLRCKWYHRAAGELQEKRSIWFAWTVLLFLLSFVSLIGGAFWECSHG
jgi:hypothetical protein